MKYYKLFDHTADLGVVFFGKTLPDLFCHAALALFDLLVEKQADAPAMPASETREIAVEGSDRTDLFINFIREILYLFNGEGFILTACQIKKLDERSLLAEVRISRYDEMSRRVRMEIKAVTYHRAAVEETANGWEGRVVFDV